MTTIYKLLCHRWKKLSCNEGGTLAFINQLDGPIWNGSNCCDYASICHFFMLHLKSDQNSLFWRWCACHVPFCPSHILCPTQIRDVRALSQTGRTSRHQPAPIKSLFAGKTSPILIDSLSGRVWKSRRLQQSPSLFSTMMEWGWGVRRGTFYGDVNGVLEYVWWYLSEAHFPFSNQMYEGVCLGWDQ